MLSKLLTLYIDDKVIKESVYCIVLFTVIYCSTPRDLTVCNVDTQKKD